MTSAANLRIVIAGGSGQVGQMLAQHFHEAGHEVTVLARQPCSAPWRTLLWDGRQQGPWTEVIDGADVLINLAGRNVNCRYTPRHRSEIMESRVQSTRLLGEVIRLVARPPALWMNASTATIYRHSLDRPMDEAGGELGGMEPGAPETWRFSIDVARSWEREFFAAETPRTRKIALRSAMIMWPSPHGIFDTLLRLVRLGLGGTAASGKQYISWIHGTDFMRALEFLVNHPEIDGVVNISSPHPLPNREFMRVLRNAWGTRIGLPAARWMLHIGALLMRSETELILKSRRVVPGRLVQAGFQFEFADWAAAAQDLARSERARRELAMRTKSK